MFRWCSVRSLLLASVALAATGCATFGFGGDPDDPQPSKTAEALTRIDARLAAIDARIGGLEKGARAGREEFAQFQHELQDARNQLYSVKRGVEAEARRRRSGLTLDVDPNAAARVAAAETIPAPVDLPPPSGAEPGTLADATLPDDTTPARLTDDAEQRMKLARYGEAVVLLSDVQTRFPQYDDGGRGLLLLADGWIKLGEPQNALPPLRQLYTRFPTSFRMPDGKLLEARAQERLGAKQKALALYRELVASHPDAPQGREARAALSRLRESP